MLDSSRNCVWRIKS